MFLSVSLLLFSGVFDSSLGVWGKKVYHVNGNELRLGEVSVHLPYVNPSNLNEDVRNVLYSAQKFASKYDEKLANVQRRVNHDKRHHSKGNIGNNMLHEVEKFRHDFEKDYNNIKNRMSSVKMRSMALRTNTMDTSLMSRLNEFVQLLAKLPAKITCLIWDCANDSTVSPTNATTLPTDAAATESYEVVEEI